jgi:hypothetical protein
VVGIILMPGNLPINGSFKYEIAYSSPT